MKITIEKQQYDHTLTEFKTTTLVFETNEVSVFDAFTMVNKSLDIISINGKHDWRERMFGEGFNPSPIVAAPVWPMPIFPTSGPIGNFKKYESPSSNQADGSDGSDERPMNRFTDTPRR